MPRGVKGSGPQKAKSPAVVEEVGTADNPNAEPGMHLPEGHQFPSVEEGQEAEDQKVFAAATEEFNEFVKSLVQNFVQQEIAGLDERIRDLELLVGDTLNQRAAAKPATAEEPEVVDYVPGGGGVPDYIPAHQGGDGTPWYQ
jgi:mRNA deadenylase 3'-5' endonuclease subunit Ccr4